MSLGKTPLVCFVGKDAEIKYTPKGTPYSFFSVAYTERYKVASGEQKEQTTWYECSIWGKRGVGVNEYIHKGTHLYLEGFVSCGSYINNDHKLVRKLTLNVQLLRFLDKANNENREEEIINDEAEAIAREAEDIINQSFEVEL